MGLVTAAPGAGEDSALNLEGDLQRRQPLLSLHMCPSTCGLGAWMRTQRGEAL